MVLITRGACAVMIVLASGALAGEARFSALPQDRAPRVTVKVNGRQIFPSKGTVRVQVGTQTFDRIEASWDRTVDVVFAQFDPKVEYVVRENPCSMFEIWRKDDERAPTHWVSFRVSPTLREAIEFRLRPGSPVVVKPGETSAPIPVLPGGAMCLHAAASFEALPAHSDWETGKPKRISYRFLRDQLLVVTYVGPQAELSLSVREKPAGLVDPLEGERGEDVSPAQ